MLIPFLKRVLPSTGHWCIVHIGDKVSNTTFIPAGDYEQVAVQIERGNNTDMNTYYGVCSFVAPESGLLKRNRDCAVRGMFRCLRIDIDIGEGKNYQTFDSSVEAIETLVAKVSLTRPLLVKSGRGLHVYFPFTTDIPYQQWLILAEGLRNCVKSEGLKFDDNIREAERLLRLPTSINQRNLAEAVVYQAGADSDVSDLMTVLGAYHRQADIPAHLRNAKVDDELESGMGFQPFSAGLAIDTCPALARMKAQGGKGVDEPTWKVTLDLIASGSETGQEKGALAILMSQGHASYTLDGLRSKLEQVIRQAYSPPSCDKMSQPECATCPFASRVKSPATLGVAGLIAATVIPDPSPGPAPGAGPSPNPSGPKLIGRVEFKGKGVTYDVEGGFRLIDGCIFKKTKVGDNWENTPVYERFAIESAVMLSNKQAGYNGMSIDFVTTRGAQGRFTLDLPTESFSDSKAMNACIMRAGVVGYGGAKRTLFGEFLMGFLGLLQSSAAQQTKHTKLGWSDIDDSFVLGDIVIHRNGTTSQPGSPVGPVIQGKVVYTAQGSEQVQVDTLNSMLVTDAAHLVIALSLATPLVRHTAFNGAIVSMYSKHSGIGKTALLKAVASVWGQPNSSLTQALTSNVAIQQKLGEAPSLPSVIDEVSTMAEAQVSQLLYEVSQGKGKDRLESSGARLQDQKTEWQTLMFVTTNKTMTDRARAVAGDSDAILARLMEIDMPPLPAGTAVGNPDMVLEENYGWVGRKVVMAIMGYEHQQWKELVAKKVLEWSQRLGLPAVQGPDRFRIAMCALADIGATIGNGLGLRLDSEAIRRCVLQVCNTIKTESTVLTITSEDILRQYMADSSNKMGKLTEGQLGWTLTSRPDGDATHGEQRFKTKANGGGVVLAETYLSMHKLAAWLRAKKFDETDFRRWCNDNDGLTKMVGLYTFMDNTPLFYRTDALWVSPRVSGIATLSVVPDNTVDKSAEKK